MMGDIFTDIDDPLSTWHELPFVQADDGEVRWWGKARPSGDVEADRQMGDLFGEMAIRADKMGESGILVALVLRDMILGGEFTALEAGFVARVSGAARAGILN